MLRFIGWRITLLLFVAVAIVYFVHLGMRMMDNPSQANGDFAADSRAAWQQTRAFLADAWRGNFGVITTRNGPAPVKEIVTNTYVNSMGLLAVTLGVSVAIGLLAGGLAAWSKRVPLALPILTLTVLGISTPSFFAALLLQIGDIQWTRVYGSSLVSSGGLGWDMRHMLLPTLVLAARPIAYLTRATFLGLNRVLGEDYIRTAWAKGLSPRHVFFDHALRNVAVPVLTAIGVSLRFALSSLPVVELFFGWPGLGERLLAAINARQTPLVAALALALGLTFVLINILLDISYRFIDPRVQET